MSVTTKLTLRDGESLRLLDVVRITPRVKDGRILVEIEDLRLPEFIIREGLPRSTEVEAASHN